ncbi:RNA polymerase sigma-70 factor [Sphingobacterium sp. LRF_L2]|uniref:RNA polymerase sigma-70 factor n=1 Tax=Sphingobacterium sp. LRF_L2 TaxID=3369421 RepID=UPI003F5E1505
MYICDDLETPVHTNVISISEKTFEQLFQEYWQRMYVFALKTTDNEDDSKEIVQDVFKSLWERRESLSIRDADRYLLRSVKLRALEFIRNKATRQRHHNIILDRSATDYEDQHIQIKELNLKLQRIIESLPKQCKNVFKMSREEGLSNKEIAKTLLISERAVEYHISKALLTLRTHFGNTDS